MPPFPGIPYGAAPSCCYPLTEFCMYILFILCFINAFKRGLSHMCYLLGGLLFGLLLEYINVISNMGYVYGKFLIMFGKAPLDIPLWIGIGWSIIMYTSRLFTDSFRLPLWTSVALDTLLAINIDLSMDTVAYRLHMWHWNWSNTGSNPLTSDWFGIPYGNFFGWLMVVFFYSSTYRLLERAFVAQTKRMLLKTILVPVGSVAFSQIALYIMLVYVDAFLYEQFGISSMHRVVSFLIILLLIAGIGWIKKKPIRHTSIPLVCFLVPLWFHLFFFTWLFIGKFYLETPWLLFTACINLVLGVSVHPALMRIRSKAAHYNTPHI